MIGTKVKVKTHKIIDYFEPIKNDEKGHLINPLYALQLANKRIVGAVVTGTKGLANMITREGPLLKNNDIRYDELGYVNFTGFVSKKRGAKNSFHSRFVVVRGFQLYWFRIDDGEHSGEYKE